MSAAEPIETDVAPGSSGHGNSQHASASEAAAVTQPAETGVAPGNSASHDNSQHTSESAPATAAAIELAEPDLPGDSVGNGTDHASNSASANTMSAAEPIETDVAPGNSSAHGNSQHASQYAAENAVAQTAVPGIGNTGQEPEPAFHFASQTTSSIPIAIVELQILNYLPVPHDDELTAILKVGPIAVEEHAASHVNNEQHHAIVLMPHDLLV
jgi:hypothetical protein